MAENSNSSNGTAAPSSAEGAEGTSPSLKDYLDFDPFEPSSEGQASEPADSGSGPQGPAPAAPEVAGDALPPESQPTEQPSAQTSAQAEDPVLRELARINETLANSRQPQYAPQQRPQAQGAKAPRYNLEIPQQILKAIIHSEDPEERAVGLAALVNGLANTIYNDVAGEFRAGQQQLYQQLPQMHQRLNQEQYEQQRAASDFFGRFQTLRPTPQMMRLVADEAKQLAVEQWNSGNRNLMWDENFREALGQRIHASLGLQFPQRGMQQQQVPQARQPKRAQFAAGGDAKGGNQNAAPNQEAKEIWDVFGYSNN